MRKTGKRVVSFVCGIAMISGFTACGTDNGVGEPPVYEGERLLSATGDLTLDFVVEGTLFTYGENGEKDTIEYAVSEETTVIGAEEVPPLVAGENAWFMQKDGNDPIEITMLGITAYIGSPIELTEIEQDMEGYYKLTSNIDFYGATYRYGAAQTITSNGQNRRFNYPIGFVESMDTSNPFNGTLDGNGYRIRYEYSYGGFNMNNHDRCLIYAIGESGVVKNLKLQVGTDEHNGVRRTALAYENKGTIENVYTDITFNNLGQNSEDFAIAGLVYTNAGTVKNSVVRFQYTSQNELTPYVGGICFKNTGTIENTACVGETTYSTVGQLVCVQRQNGVVENMPLYADVSALNDGLSAFEKAGFTIGGVWSKDELDRLCFGSIAV